TTSNATFSIDEWSNSKNVSIVGNAGYCFDLIWEEKENYDRVVKEKNHSDLLFDVISQRLGSKLQRSIIVSSRSHLISLRLGRPK
ncbi:MAG: hypothetical protein WAM27_05740, partial [Nitrososphaeraceae archaeon]